MEVGCIGSLRKEGKSNWWKEKEILLSIFLRNGFAFFPPWKWKEDFSDSLLFPNPFSSSFSWFVFAMFANASSI